MPSSSRVSSSRLGPPRGAVPVAAALAVLALRSGPAAGADLPAVIERSAGPPLPGPVVAAHPLRFARHHILVQPSNHAHEREFLAAAATVGMRRGARVYGTDWLIVELPAGADARAMVATAATMPGVSRVALDALISVNEQFVPHDPLHVDGGNDCDPLAGCYDQWGLLRVEAELGRQETTGSPNVVIAVLDSGVDLDHDDLFANVWSNVGEVPDNGFDDDGDGWVDDVVDVVAPGESIWSTWVLAAYDALLYEWDPGTDTYSLADGTSFSTPLVAGYLGLLKSKFPGATTAQLRQVLRSNASSGIGGPGYDAGTGFGRLRMVVPTSIDADTNLAPVADIAGDQAGSIVVADSGRSGVESVTLDGTPSYDPDGQVVDYRWSWLDADGVIRQATGATLTLDLTVGPEYFVTLLVEDDAGASSPGATVAVTVSPTTAGGRKGGGGGGHSGKPKSH
jgi:subtilisin family serine protease